MTPQDQPDSQALSNCHKAPVTIGGSGDFDDKDRAVTQYYVCSECSQPCDLWRADSQAVHKTFAFKKSGRVHPTNNHEEFMMTDTRDSQAGDDPTEAIQRLCDDKFFLSSTELAERFTKLYNYYAERLAAERAVELAEGVIGEDYKHGDILDGVPLSMIHRDLLRHEHAKQRQRLAELSATLTKEKQA